MWDKYMVFRLVAKVQCTGAPVQMGKRAAQLDTDIIWG